MHTSNSPVTPARPFAICGDCGATFEQACAPDCFWERLATSPLLIRPRRRPRRRQRYCDAVVTPTTRTR